MNLSRNARRLGTVWALALGGWLALAGATPPAGAASASGVTVPASYTAVTVQPLSKSTFPFLGTDGRYHVSYDLLLTNASILPATIERVDVVDAAKPSEVVGSFANDLVDPKCRVGYCEDLRLASGQAAPDKTIPPQESRILFIDLSFGSLDQAPKVVLHHLYLTASPAPPATTVTSVNYLATPFSISGGSPRVISAPLRGNNWVALNGCCQTGLQHRDAVLPLDGHLSNSERFAIDFKRMNNQGRFYVGDKTKNQSYVDYGSPIIAVANGTISSTLDNVDANAPGVLPSRVPRLAAKLTVANVDGNHIIENLGGGVYAMYAHLQKGSLLVKPGEKVHTGEVLAKLGNTGNANVSHLHFQLMNGPNIIGSDGLPFEINHFVYAGQVSLSAIQNADNYLTGTFFSGHLAKGQPRTNQTPLAQAIVNFPG